MLVGKDGRLFFKPKDGGESFIPRDAADSRRLRSLAAEEAAQSAKNRRSAN